MALGNMPENGNEDIVAEINMTPLIDIMLVLLIIFMVTSSISLESGLEIDIPKTASQTKQSEGKAVIISLSKTGELSIQGTKVPREELQNAITAALAQAGTKQVILEGDQDSTLASTIEIIDVAKSAGAEKFSIAADEAATAK